MEVRLTDDEAMFARYLGELEAAEEYARKGEPASAFIKEGHVHGARLAMCKALNLYPDLSPSRNRKLISRTGKNVKLIYTPDPIFLYPIDGMHEVYVVMNGKIPIYDLVGYTFKESIGSARGIQPRALFKLLDSDICKEFIEDI